MIGSRKNARAAPLRYAVMPPNSQVNASEEEVPDSQANASEEEVPDSEPMNESTPPDWGDAAQSQPWPWDSKWHLLENHHLCFNALFRSTHQRGTGSVTHRLEYNYYDGYHR